MNGSESPHQSTRTAAVVEIALVVATFFVASFLRLYHFTRVPGGLLLDEGYNGVDAVKILAGWRPIFLPANNGREALFQYLQACAIGALGQTDWALRVPAVACSLLTLPVSYVLVRRLLGGRVALLTSAWLAVSFWHVMYSRIGLRTIMLPLVLAAAFYFLWLGLDRVALTEDRGREATAQRSGGKTTGRPADPRAGLGWFALGGVVLGIAQYTYTTARFAPLVVVAFAAYLALFHPSLFRRSIPGLIVAALAASVVFAPEGWYFLHHSDDFVNRAQEVSVFNQSLDASMNFQTPASALVYSASQSLGMFVFHGDDQWDRNIPGRPVYDPISAVFLILGTALLFRRGREPRSAFVLIWLFLMLIPSVLSIRNVPNFLRVTGLIPAVFALPALGVDELWRYWEKYTSGWLRLLPGGFLALAFAAGTYQTYQDYFVFWAHQASVSETFSADRLLASAIGRQIAQQSGASVFVGSGNPDESVERYALTAANVDDRVHLFDGQQSIVFPVVDGPVTYIFPRRYLPAPSLLERCFGRANGKTVAVAPDGDTVLRYDLLSPCLNPVPEQLLPAFFGETLQVYGFDVPRDVPAGGVLTVRWYWKIIGPTPRELVFFNHLYDTSNHRVSELDNRSFAPNYWPVGTRGISSFDLKIDPSVPTGAYPLFVGVYQHDTLDHLPVSDTVGRNAGAQIRLGPIKVHGAGSPRVDVPHPQLARLADSIDLLGYGTDPQPAMAGQPLTLTLYWSARARPSRNYTVFVHLLDAQGHLLTQADSPPQAGQYPTSLWDTGETIADRHVLDVPAHLPPGSYSVEVGIYRSDSGQRLSILDSSGQPQGDRILLSGVMVR